MGSFGNYLENELLDHVLKVGSYTVPTNIYIALSTADPTDAGTGVAEPPANGYARTLCNVWNIASSGSTANTSDITFSQATGTWGTITHFAIFDGTAGNMLAHGALTASKTVGNGDTVKFSAGDLDITLD